MAGFTTVAIIQSMTAVCAQHREWLGSSFGEGLTGLLQTTWLVLTARNPAPEAGGGSWAEKFDETVFHGGRAMMRRTSGAPRTKADKTYC